MLQGKHILLGVTGSIAAYKAAMLCRLLRVAGAEVKVVMTPTAKEFITPVTMATLSKNPIAVEFYNPENGDWHSHIAMGEWADCYLIAPATANTIAKMAYGIADNLLLTTYLSARCQTVVAPAMDCDMFCHEATQENLAKLRERGVVILESPEGELASGLMGKGRMMEPEQIVEEISRLFAAKQTLSGKRVMVTAGATIEAIDPVRYISNHSTGKMGYAIAEALAKRGAEVVLVSGKTSLPTPQGVRRVDVCSAEDMYNAAVAEFEQADCAVMCAAVADYTPAEVATNKIKKSDAEFTLSLRKTKDIAFELGKVKGSRKIVGFALETDNEQSNAEEKLRKKNLDLIVLNSLRDKGAGFGCDTNKVSFIDASHREELPLLSKTEVAERIADRIEKLLK
ncbi:MAG: bifunctional phosphopantothenoylcysteine decarboxylase/phosphopantothenate--cysteine ligase CoaBC [Rikenellaceae bacterium]|nr:bifunctional phosphopantothenoylcysteine decarboxylase/phosphopantothenate--cysteine ligase CoaBC [Rikenellaceae bacterium]